MPTIKEKIKFNYDGVWSDTLGLMHVVLAGGLFEEQLGATREIIETEVRGGKSLLHEVKEKSLQFEMTIAFKDDFDDSSIDYIIRWLFDKTYKPLFFEGAENKVFMCMPVDSPTIFHTGTKKGYFTINMRCDSPNLYSPYISSPLETVTTTKTITINNDGHYDIYPEISILKNGAGNVTIENITDGGSIFEIRDLTNLEDLYIDCEKEIIVTDAVGITRYDKIIGEFTRLVYGNNQIKITGACTIQIRYKNKYKF